MEHSIAAKFAARPSARFVRPSTRARQRRLGLRAANVFNAAPSQATERATLSDLRLPASGARCRGRTSVAKSPPFLLC